MSPTVLLERRGPVLVITLNRPEVRNAVNAEMAAALHAAVDELEGDPSCAVGVITGAGGVFCSGMDLRAFAGGEHPSVGQRGFAGITAKPPVKPMIAAAEGAAVAGGFEIVLSCDLVVAADDARFGLPEVKRGLVADAGGLLRLPRRIPHHIAMEWALTGELVSAQEAHRVGLVNRLTPPGGALDAAIALARVIADNAPLAVGAAKRIITASREWDAVNEFMQQDVISRPIRESEDALEGARAFTEKRKPRWRSR